MSNNCLDWRRIITLMGLTAMLACSTSFRHIGADSANVMAAQDCGDTCATLTALAEMPYALTIGWTEVPANAESFALWYGEDPQAVRARSAPAQRWGTAEDSNLAWMRSPFGAQEVRRTTLRDLTATTLYHIDLWVWFADGTAGRVATGEFMTTPLLPEQRVIFDETQPPGSFLICLQVANLDGNTVLQAALDADPARCGPGWNNLTIGGVGLDVSSLSASQWQSAVIEFDMVVGELGGSPPVGYVEVAIFDGLDRTYRLSVPHYLSVPAHPGWQRYHLPLRDLQDTGGQSLVDGGFGPTFSGIQVGARFAVGDDIKLDNLIFTF